MNIKECVMQAIYGWVSDNFGPAEAYDPSWNIEYLADHIAMTLGSARDNEKPWYYILVEEWLVPTESGREVLESTYDTIDEAREAAISHFKAEKADFELATGLKATNPEEYGDYMVISTPAEGQDDEWYDCVKIVPLSYGVMPIIGHRPEMPHER